MAARPASWGCVPGKRCADMLSKPGAGERRGARHRASFVPSGRTVPHDGFIPSAVRPRRRPTRLYRVRRPSTVLRSRHPRGHGRGWLTTAPQAVGGSRSGGGPGPKLERKSILSVGPEGDAAVGRVLQPAGCLIGREWFKVCLCSCQKESRSVSLRLQRETLTERTAR